jgi:hypothetical protein
LDQLRSSSYASDEVEMDGLVQTLLGIDILQDPEGLRMCVERSEREIGEKIPAPPAGWTENIDDADVLHELVKQLMWRDAAMWVFLDTIEDLYGPYHLVESARAAVRSVLAEPFLAREHRHAIHQLCENLVCADAAALFRASVGGAGHTLESDAGNLCAVLNELENLSIRTDGLHPIVAFIAYLAGEQQPEYSEQLQLWAESRVGNSTPLLQALHEIWEQASTVTEAAPRYCVVRLDVDGLDSDRFLVSLMVQEGTSQPEPLRPPDDQVYTEEQVRMLLGLALRAPILAGAGDPVVEFFLPAELINQPVDQWNVGYGDIALGVQYPVIVRSLDRIRCVSNSFDDWRFKWRRIKTARFHRGNAAVAWIPQEAHEDRDRLYVMLSGRSGPVCLLLQVSPEPHRCGALLVALRAGTPVLLWCRQDTADIAAGLSQMMAQSAPLGELPWRIFAFRRAAVHKGTDKQHLARHLTLLWDDADRIPDADSPLLMPS